MAETYNVYCDESCHLQHDNSSIMVIGAIWCPKNKVPEISEQVAQIKRAHDLDPAWECKWTKVSPKKISLYLELINFVFDNDDIHFRGIVILSKNKLRHPEWYQTHDEWYYKMFFRMLDIIIDPRDIYRIYIDIKDTHSSKSAEKLREVLCNARYDFDRSIIQWIQPIRSHESSLMQLTDLVIGAISYHSRNLTTSEAKLSIVRRLQERSLSSLEQSTFLGARKFNLFLWQPKDNS